MALGPRLRRLGVPPEGTPVNRRPRRYWHEHRGAAFCWFSCCFAIWAPYSTAAGSQSNSKKESTKSAAPSTETRCCSPRGSHSIARRQHSRDGEARQSSRSLGPASQFTKISSRKPATVSGSLSASNAKTATIVSWHSSGTAT